MSLRGALGASGVGGELHCKDLKSLGLLSDPRSSTTKPLTVE